jgi:type IV secretory pathway VirB10-like protein
MIVRFGVELFLFKVRIMVIPDFKQICLTLFILLFSFSVSAEIYKWVDENGQTHFSQTPPDSGIAEKVDVPPPPPIDPEQAQTEVDTLIEQQQEAEKAEQLAQQEREKAAEEQAIREENCRIARSNLTTYQNNPGRRVVDADGNVTRMVEEERQQKMQEFQEQIDLYCQ